MASNVYLSSKGEILNMTEVSMYGIPSAGKQCQIELPLTTDPLGYVYFVKIRWQTDCLYCSTHA